MDAASKLKAANGFIDHFKIGAGSVAVTMFICIILALFAVIIVAIIEYSEKTTRFLIIIGCIVGVMVAIVAYVRPWAFRLSLLGYALLGVAVFTGFIYNDGRDTFMRIISIALFGAACVLEYWFY
jgi:hypothetical protein